jgi:hypothetical protein
MEGLVIFAVIFLAFGSLMGSLAARKGYSFGSWFLAAGLVGLITLAFLPFTNRGDLSPEVAAEKRARGNTIGGVLSALAIGLGVLRFIAGV